MAITRKLREILISFDAAGNPAVTVTGLISDDVEGTSTGKAQSMAQAPVIAEAVALRDAVMTVAANAGKPLTF